ncbi:bifunctional adenosylcobinamide kinase/adenosylcobinamide-phosphate guanylyltransferase [Bacillus daqingensis]|uniref:Adenosylcobinamide kinase n=1 Tax=Bacillus daqingensis TaxID=872396 RepID=A0ABV9NT63_9BACI
MGRSELTFISGGARSGKSAWAEHLVLTQAEHPVYLATASVTDAEMEARISKHREDRNSRFRLIEEQTDLIKALPKQGAVLLDCLTIWTANLLYQQHNSEHDVIDAVTALLDEARRRELMLTIVSNDVNESVLPRAEEVHRYVRVLEAAHRQLVKRADHVYQVQAGMPVCWKGSPL